MGCVPSLYQSTKSLSVPQIYAGGIFNAIGGLLRVISTLNPVICSSVFMNAGFVVALLGQTLTACAQPFLLYAPTTLASVWFGPNERAVATGLTSLGKPINQLTFCNRVKNTSLLILLRLHNACGIVIIYVYLPSKSNWASCGTSGLSIHSDYC